MRFESNSFLLLNDICLSTGNASGVVTLCGYFMSTINFYGPANRNGGDAKNLKFLPIAKSKQMLCFPLKLKDCSAPN